MALKRISQISGMMIWLFITGILVFLIFLMSMPYLGMMEDASKDTFGAAKSQDAKSQIEKYTKGEKTSNPIIAARDQQIQTILNKRTELPQVQILIDDALHSGRAGLRAHKESEATRIPHGL